MRNCMCVCVHVCVFMHTYVYMHPKSMLVCWPVYRKVGREEVKA